MAKARGGPSNRLHAKPHQDPGTGLQQPQTGAPSWWKLRPREEPGVGAAPERVREPDPIPRQPNSTRTVFVPEPRLCGGCKVPDLRKRRPIPSQNRSPAWSRDMLTIIDAGIALCQPPSGARNMLRADCWPLRKVCCPHERGRPSRHRHAPCSCLQSTRVCGTRPVHGPEGVVTQAAPAAMALRSPVPSTVNAVWPVLPSPQPDAVRPGLSVRAAPASGRAVVSPQPGGLLSGRPGPACCEPGGAPHLHPQPGHPRRPP